MRAIIEMLGSLQGSLSGSGNRRLGAPFCIEPRASGATALGSVSAC